MAIKARFPAGVTSIKLDSLHQWDYGQQLEIESEDALSSIVEVHFSCSGMNEATVRVCSMNSNIATVTIPDICLEQTGTITAWIYEINGSQGRTTKSITIPIISRARPDRTLEPSDEFSTSYTQLITEVNNTLDALRSGEIVVKEAVSAEEASHAFTANGLRVTPISLNDLFGTIAFGGEYTKTLTVAEMSQYFPGGVFIARAKWTMSGGEHTRGCVSMIERANDNIEHHTGMYFGDYKFILTFLNNTVRLNISTNTNNPTNLKLWIIPVS